jgi:TP901 family phage tail tape measure protein
LRDKAKEMGAATNFSATEAAEGLNILAMSGYDATSSMEMIEDVLHLAAAGGMEMSQSADFIAGSMKGFNDETKDSAYYADLMAKGATLANTSVAELGEAMSGGAATAAAYGQEADSMTLALLRLAEQGVSGSAASTSLNAAMKDLYTPTDDAKKALSELGVAIYDENGKAREFNTVVNELNGALADMSDEEANAYKSTIFQIQGLQAFNKMTVTSTEKQEEWAAALAEASGEASRQYATMTDNLQGDIDIWNSALDGFKIAISDELTPTIREFVQFGSSSMGKLTEAFETGGISGAMGALGEILSDGLAMVVDILPSMIDAGMQLIGALGQGLLDNLPMILDAVMQILRSIGQGILDALPMLIGAAAQIIITLATGIGQALPELIPTIVETVLLVVSTLIDNLPLLLDAGMQLIGGLIEGIVAAIPLLIEQLPELILQIVNFLTENLPTILEQGSQMIMTLATGILDALPDLVAQLPAIITGIVGFITESLPLIIETGINLLVQLGLGIIQAIVICQAKHKKMTSKIQKTRSELPAKGKTERVYHIKIYDKESSISLVWNIKLNKGSQSIPQSE